MAKRNTNGGAATSNGNGNSRPALAIKTNDNGQVLSHIQQKWLIETPEERVRQAYVVALHNGCRNGLLFSWRSLAKGVGGH